MRKGGVKHLSGTNRKKMTAVVAADRDEKSRSNDNTTRRRPARTIAYAHLLKLLSTPDTEGIVRLPSERALSDQLDISRRSIRVALQDLEDSGMVDRVVGRRSMFRVLRAEAPKQGHLVVPDTGVIDVVEIRHILDPKIIEMACARATQDDFARMEQQLVELETAKDHPSHRRAGYGLQLEIARSTRNPLAIAIYEMLWAARQRLGWEHPKASVDIRKFMPEWARGKRRLVELIRTRDSVAAVKLANSQTSSIVDRISSAVDRS